MDNNGNPQRILHIVSAMERGGAETLIMNIYRNIDRKKLQFDFITHSKNKGDFDDEIISLGGKIFRIDSLGKIGPFLYLKELMKIMSTNQYIAIHSHMDYQSGFPALAARICGIKKRICHSHSSNWSRSKGIKNLFILKTLQSIIKFSATNYCSCSKEAAVFLFGNKKINQGKVEILKNGIDINEFIKVKNRRDSLIKELNLPIDTKIIGHVGRFSESKNHIFILKVLKRVIKVDPSFVALLVGDGPLKEKIEEKAKEMQIIENIRFLGIRDDIPRLMKAFDVFILPSLFEGFGIVTIEAQCAGTPCVVSDTVPKTTDMGLNLITYIKLEDDLSRWLQEINKATLLKRPENKIIYSKIINNGFSIEENVPKWLSLYGIDNQSSLRVSVDL